MYFTKSHFVLCRSFVELLKNHQVFCVFSIDHGIQVAFSATYQTFVLQKSLNLI